MDGLELQKDDSTEPPVLVGDIVEVLGVQVCLYLVEDVFDCHRVAEHAEQEGFEKHSDVASEVGIAHGREIVGLVGEEVAVGEGLRVAREEPCEVEDGALEVFPGGRRYIVVEEGEVVDGVDGAIETRVHEVRVRFEVETLQELHYERVVRCLVQWREVLVVGWIRWRRLLEGLFFYITRLFRPQLV